MQRRRMRSVQLACLGELLGHQNLALAEDDSGLLFALGLSHPRQRILQVVGHFDIAQLNRLDLDAPRLGLLVEGDGQLLVELAPL